MHDARGFLKKAIILLPERLEKFCGRLKRGFLSSGEASATEHVRSDLRRSRNAARTQKDRSLSKFSNGYRISLIALMLIAASSVVCAQTQKTIGVLGDSLAAGFGVDPDQAYPSLLQQKITAAGLPLKIINAGVSGDTTARWIRPFELAPSETQNQRLLIIELGGNDGPCAAFLSLQFDQTSNRSSDRAKAKIPQY